MKKLKLNYALVITGVAIAGFLHSCNNQSDSVKQKSSSDITQKLNDSAEVAVSSSPTTEEKAKLHLRLEELSNKIDSAIAKIDNQMAIANANTRAKLAREKATLASAKATLKTQLNKFDTSSYMKWDEAKAGISNMIDSLENKLKLD